MNYLLDVQDQYPAAFQDRRPPIDSEVELCQEWLADQEAEDWTDSTAGSMKHHMPEHVRTASLMAALVLDGWPVTVSADQLVIG